LPVFRLGDIPRASTISTKVLVARQMCNVTPSAFASIGSRIPSQIDFGPMGVDDHRDEGTRRRRYGCCGLR
jgi:hypothetical protein